MLHRSWLQYRTKCSIQLVSLIFSEDAHLHLISNYKRHDLLFMEALARAREGAQTCSTHLFMVSSLQWNVYYYNHFADKQRNLLRGLNMCWIPSRPKYVHVSTWLQSAFPVCKPAQNLRLQLYRIEISLETTSAGGAVHEPCACRAASRPGALDFPKPSSNLWIGKY